MRKGKVVSISKTIDEKLSSLANKMIGEKLEKIKKITSNNLSGEEILRVSSLNFNSDDPYEVNLVDINFTLNKGECLGIAGISGNGQNELFQILSGETLSNNGSIKFRGKEISKLNPKERREYLMAFSPEDRISQAAVPSLKIYENVALNNFKTSNFFEKGLFNKKKIKDHSKKNSIKFFSKY